MDEIKKAAEIIKKGGIVIFPTDTAYGIGCSLENEKTIKKLFKIRKRPKTQATPVLFSSIEQVEKYVLPFDDSVRSLMTKYWPGALTIVLKCKIRKAPSLVRGGGNTLGIRIPNNKKILKIIDFAGVPILGPSANFHGEATPFAFEDLNPKLVDLANYVVEGNGSLKKPSTVIDCSASAWKIIREGAVKISL